MSTVLADQVVAEVRAELGRQGKNNADLARALGKSQMWVSRTLRGQRPLTLTELDAIAAVLDVPVQRFLSPMAA